MSKADAFYKRMFMELFVAVAACEPPEETQLDEVLSDFQNAYDQAREGK